MANFQSPSAHQVATISADSAVFDDPKDNFSVLRLYLVGPGGSCTFPIFGPLEVGDKFERVAAAINEIFAEPK